MIIRQVPQGRGPARVSPGRGPIAAGMRGSQNQIVLRRIRRHGVQAHDASVRCVRSVGDAGLRRAVVSSSTNCGDVLAAASLGERVDGLTAERDHLVGKPAADMFLAAAWALGAAPADAVAFEDALAGVAAGRAGGFGFAVGAGRAGQAIELQAHGADVMMADLAELPGAS